MLMIAMQTLLLLIKVYNSKEGERLIAISNNNNNDNNNISNISSIINIIIVICSNIIWVSDFNYRVSLLNEEARLYVNTKNIEALLRNDQVIKNFSKSILKIYIKIFY